MKLELRGCTRFVILCGKYVIKIPKFWRWTNMLRGLLANINEGQTWRWNSGKYSRGKEHLLCPVVFTGIGGLFLIMRKADPMDEDWWEKVDIPPYWEHIQHFKGDDKPCNYGWYKGKLVKTDYGDLDLAWGVDFKPE